MTEPTPAGRLLRLKAIRQRDEETAGTTGTSAMDRRWLLAEVERLTRERDEARSELEAARARVAQLLAQMKAEDPA